MKKDEKVWASIFKMEGLKCACGNDLEVHSIRNLGKKYLLIRGKEDCKIQDEFYFLYDKKQKCIVSPGGFSLHGLKEEIEDPTVRRIISYWEKKGRA